VGWSEAREYDADLTVDKRVVHVQFTQYVFHDYDDIDSEGNSFNEEYEVNGVGVSYRELKQILGPKRTKWFLQTAVEQAR
jgi:hypothetical protein